MEMEMSREGFIEAMIAELQQQKSLNGGGNFVSKPLDGLQVFRKLCFDFPEITGVEIETLNTALISSLDSVAKGGKIVGIVNDGFYLHHKLIENVVEMASESHSAKTESVSQFGSTLFIKTVKFMMGLEMGQLEVLLGHPHDSSHKLTWLDVIRFIGVIASKCTASLLTSVKPENLLRGYYLTDICWLVEVMSPFRDANADKETATSKDTLGKIISIAWSHTNLNNSSGRSSHSSSNSSGNSNSNSSSVPKLNDRSIEPSPEEYIGIAEQVRNMWIHYIFLARDVLVEYPELLVTTLTKFGSSMLSGLYEPSGRAHNGENIANSPLIVQSSSRFHHELSRSSRNPLAAECLFVLVLSALSDSVCVCPLELDSSRFASAGESNNNGPVNSGKSNKGRIHRKLQGLKYLAGYVSTQLSCIASICENMMNQSINASDDGVDAVDMLVNIVRTLASYSNSSSNSVVALSRPPGIGRGQSHEMLVTSRVLPILVGRWVRWTSDLLAIKADTLQSDDKQTVKASILPVWKKLSYWLGHMVLLHESIIAYISRLPGFSDALILLAATWADVCQQDNDTNPTTGSTLSPAVLLPLCLGLHWHQYMPAKTSIDLLDCCLSSLFYTVSSAASAEMTWHNEQCDLVTGATDKAVISAEVTSVFAETVVSSASTTNTITETTTSVNLSMNEVALERRRRKRLPEDLLETLHLLCFDEVTKQVAQAVVHRSNQAAVGVSGSYRLNEWTSNLVSVVNSIAIVSLDRQTQLNNTRSGVSSVSESSTTSTSFTKSVHAVAPNANDQASLESGDANNTAGVEEEQTIEQVDKSLREERIELKEEYVAGNATRWNELKRYLKCLQNVLEGDSNGNKID